MRCGVCGTDNPEGARFCASCGSAFDVTSQYLEPMTTNGVQQQEPPVAATEPPRTPSGLNEAANGTNAQVTEPKAQASRHGLSKKVLVALLGLAAVTVVAVVALFFVVPQFRANVVLLDYDGKGTVSKELEGWKGSSATLPGPIVVREGYIFLGWVPNDARGNEGMMKEGDQVELDGRGLYRGVWSITLSFDGNGADQGKTESIASDSGGAFVFPESGFSRKGFVFAGWSESKEEREYTRLPGEKGYAYEPTTYYAIWIPQLDLQTVTVKGLEGASGSIEGWDTNTGVVALLIKNETGMTVSFSTDLTLHDDAGSIVGTEMDYVSCIGAGETTLAYSSPYDTTKATQARYAIEVQEVGDFYEPAINAIKQEVASVDKDGLSLKLTNTGDKAVRIDQVKAVAKDGDGALYLANGYYYVLLKPGESGSVTFNNESLLTYGQNVSDWREVECTFYVSCYSEKEF